MKHNTTPFIEEVIWHCFFWNRKTSRARKIQKKKQDQWGLVYVPIHLVDFCLSIWAIDCKSSTWLTGHFGGGFPYFSPPLGVTSAEIPRSMLSLNQSFQVAASPDVTSQILHQRAALHHELTVTFAPDKKAAVLHGDLKRFGSQWLQGLKSDPNADLPYSRCSMYGLFTYIWVVLGVNVNRYGCFQK